MTYDRHELTFIGALVGYGLAGTVGAAAWAFVTMVVWSPKTLEYYTTGSGFPWTIAMMVISFGGPVIMGSFVGFLMGGKHDNPNRLPHRSH